jgi:DNA-binding NarL/FixJ family response regulator
MQRPTPPSPEMRRLEDALRRASATLAVTLRNTEMVRASFALYRRALNRAVRTRARVSAALAAAPPVAPRGAPRSGNPTGARPAGVVPGLSPREAEVAHLVAAGLTNKAIGRKLTLEEGTIANHVRRIRLKLGLSSRAELAAWVVRNTRDTGGRPN